MSQFVNRRVSQPHDIARPSERWRARGLVALANGATLVDHVSGRPLTLTGGGARTVSANGLSQQMTGTQYASIPVAGVSGVPTTLFALARMSSFAATRVVCGLGQSGTATHVSELYFDAPFDQLNFLQITAGSLVQPATGTNTAFVDTYYAVAGVARTTTLREAYINATVGTDATSRAFPTVDTFYIGVERYNGSFAGQFQGDIPLAAVFASALTADELAELRENPWALFEPRRIWVPVAVAGGGGGFQAAWARNRSQVIGAGVR